MRYIKKEKHKIQIQYILKDRKRHSPETTNDPRVRIDSLCSSFSDRSNIWPVVYSVLLNSPELPSVFTQYLFHSESRSLRSSADLK